MWESTALANVIDLQQHPLHDQHYHQACRQQLYHHGALVLSGFIQPEALLAMQQEGKQQKQHVYYTNDQHNVYLLPQDDQYDEEHPRNRLITSTKGCITDDLISEHSPLRQLYNNAGFQRFLCAILEEQQLFPYADPLSSINIHYASQNQELGWHFDNSNFAITLLIEKPEAGGCFEYVKDLRDTHLPTDDKLAMNYDGVKKVLNGTSPVNVLPMQAGDLTLFRGKHSLHRVTPTQGDITRMLAVLAYNTEPDISLSEHARLTFYGRIS